MRTLSTSAQSFQEETKMKQEYSFLTDQIAYEIIETKSGKDYFITGYISTSDLDLVNDVVTPDAMKSMLDQINASNITLDYEHEAFRDDPTILPVGKIIEAKIDDRGLWVKCQLNSGSPKFKNLWESVKGGFLNAFSIAFTNVKSITKTIGDVLVRSINDLKLLNVAITGVPVNPHATIDGTNMKNVFLKAIDDYEKNKEDNKMSDDKIDKKSEEVVEQTAEEPKVEAQLKEEVQEEPKEEIVEEAKEQPAEQKSDVVANELKSLKERIEAQEAEIKSLKEKSVFKSQITEEAPKAEIKEMEMKSVLNIL